MSQSQNGYASGGKPTTNGPQAHSQTLDHVTSYPLISDLLAFYSHNSLGAKSIDAFNTLYASLVAPLLPYLRTPLSIASPYLTRADELGDSALKSVDERFPAVKSTDYNDLRAGASSAAGYPFRLAGDGRKFAVRNYEDGRKYIVRVYEDESKKAGGEGVVNVVKSVVGTEIHVLGDAVEVGKSVIGMAKEEAGRVNGKVHEKVNGKGK